MEYHAGSEMNPEIVLREWLFRVRRSQIAHYNMADHYDRLHFYIGIPTIVLTTLVGTSVFATLKRKREQKSRYWWLGLV
jgi:hypothetical protein